MSLDPRTPVLVGAAALSQHVEDPFEASEPLDLMAEVLEGDRTFKRDFLRRR